MPQLDYTLLFNQIFWLFLIFISSYIVIIYLFLPVLLKVFKSRKQILGQHQKNTAYINEHQKNTDIFYNKAFFKCNNLLKNALINFNYCNKIEKSLLDSTLIYSISSWILHSQFYKKN